MKRMCTLTIKVDNIAPMEEDDSNITGHSDINILNDDCLLHIFQYLSPKNKLSFSKVSKRWNGLSEVYWTETKMTIHYDLCSVQYLECLSYEDFKEILDLAGSALTNVFFENASMDPSSSTSDDISLQFANYKYKLNECTVSQALELLSQFCCEVKVVGACLTKSFPVSSFFNFLRCNEQVEELVIDGNCKCFPHDLYKVENFVKSLKRLKLICCFDVTNNGLQLFLEQATNLEELRILDGNLIRWNFLESLSTHSKRLRKLHLADYTLYGIFESAIKLLSQLNNLEELCLKGFESALTNDALIEIMKSCNKLNHLSINGASTGCSEITHAGIMFALSNLPDLQVLHLENLANVEKLVSGNARFNLKELKIYGCPKLSIDEICNAIRVMPLLSSLEIDNEDDDKLEFERLIVFGIDTAISRVQNFLVSHPRDDEEYEIVAYKTAARRRMNCSMPLFSMHLARLRPVGCLSERELLDIVVNHVRYSSPTHKVFTRRKKLGMMNL